MTDTPTILIYATYRIQLSDVEAFRDIASRMGSAARLRDGCVFLDITEEVGAAGTFRLIEAWRDQAALTRTSPRPILKRYSKKPGNSALSTVRRTPIQFRAERRLICRPELKERGIRVNVVSSGRH
ncbi:antibiotic biosynthesis monooxygenase [Sphingomonas sp. Ant20]|uniref:putative quinol monooxygenase n=1 Tax=Sphingomonas sp. Ant20 TaxID=104605 RepID=UPI0005378C5F|nr:antibiotic biosynthesis monooxygenase [Sphingomonas sp. Ant20]KHA65217.1 hypothetical protein NI18_03960 [Sphingomonas sp. Ant20]